MTEQSAQHGQRIDDELSSEVDGLVRGAPIGTRAREDLDPEAAETRVPERIDEEHHDAALQRSELARFLRPSALPADATGRLDQGLIFMAYNASIQRQFEVIQRRLAGEPLTDYVKPTGGGYFYLPPGARGADDWVGSGILS